MHPIEDQTCANCAHCSEATVSIGGHKYHTCAKAALDGDVDGTMTLVSLCSNCTAYAGEWEPSAEYLAECEDDALHQSSPEKYYGVCPGVDFPATLAM